MLDFCIAIWQLHPFSRTVATGRENNAFVTNTDKRYGRAAGFGLKTRHIWAKEMEKRKN
jgi:hypothetical protein